MPGASSPGKEGVGQPTWLLSVLFTCDHDYIQLQFFLLFPISLHPLRLNAQLCEADCPSLRDSGKCLLLSPQRIINKNRYSRRLRAMTTQLSIPKFMMLSLLLCLASSC